jgi:hypothetical protein
LGSGDGWLQKLLVKKFPNINFICIDAKLAELNNNNSEISGGVVEFLNNLTLDKNNKIDIILSSDFIEHLSYTHLVETFNLVSKLLTTSGLFVNFTPSKLFASTDFTRNTKYNNTGSLCFHLSELSPFDLVNLCKNCNLSYPKFALFGFLGFYSKIFTKFWILFYKRFYPINFSFVSYFLGCNFFVVSKR